MNDDFLSHYTNFQLPTHQITEASVIIQKPVYMSSPVQAPFLSNSSHIKCSHHTHSDAMLVTV